MKGGGRYIRVWVYGANAAYLADTPNEGRTVNEALAAYSQMQTGNITVPVGSLTGTVSGVTPRAMSLSTSSTYQPPKLTCDNGHLLNALTGKCVGKLCGYAK